MPPPSGSSLAQHNRLAGPHQLVVLLGEQQDAADIGLVVVERVELWGGHVEGPCLREAIVQLLVEREQVHVVHGDVVCAVAALQEAHIDECRPVEPVQNGQGWAGYGQRAGSPPDSAGEPVLYTTHPGAYAALPADTDFTVELSRVTSAPPFIAQMFTEHLLCARSC